MTEEEIKRHKIAAKKLIFIKNQAFDFIKANIGKISEYDVSKLILSEFKKNGLETERGGGIPIVALNKNTSYVHYFPNKESSKIINKNSLILLDIWAKLKEKGSPFADITWMGYVGSEIPLEVLKIFNAVIKARDVGIKFIEKQLRKGKIPKGKEIDEVVRGYFKALDKEAFFMHSTGHSLGFSKCHGEKFNLSKEWKKGIKPNIPFTIEPGLYFENKFGVRSEIDCYITQDYKLVLTTDIQKKLVVLKY